MKHLRLWLIVLLVALLPIRGAMAAAMLCAPGGAAGQADLRVADPGAHAQHLHHGGAAEAPSGQHGAHGAHGQTEHHAATDDNKCTMCSAFCSATPLPSAMPNLPEPMPMGEARFHHLDAPAPTFQSGGPERPPRSI